MHTGSINDLYFSEVDDLAINGNGMSSHVNLINAGPGSVIMYQAACRKISATLTGYALHMMPNVLTIKVYGVEHCKAIQKAGLINCSYGSSSLAHYIGLSQIRTGLCTLTNGNDITQDMAGGDFVYSLYYLYRSARLAVQGNMIQDLQVVSRGSTKASFVGVHGHADVTMSGYGELAILGSRKPSNNHLCVEKRVMAFFRF